MLDRNTSSALAALIAAAVALGGCAGVGGPSLGSAAGMATGSLADKDGGAAEAAATAPPTDQSASGPAQTAAAKGAAPAPNATLALARALRDKGEKAKALAELERDLKDKPADRELAREAGILALELGQIDKAKKSLTAALDKAHPDFHVQSALGTAHASSGNQRDAQSHYKQALKLRPDHRPTLNNLALSYALEGDLAKAESTLKSASKGTETPQQVKENLALVLALAGKFDDAEKIATGVMPKGKAAANMAYLRSLTDKEKGG